MSDEEIRLKCLELAKEVFGTCGFDSWFRDSKRIYDFCHKKSDTEIDVAKKDIS